jgi:hypothetical protein
LLASIAGLIAYNRTRTALAFQAMAHGYTHWLALDRKVKLPATAGSVLVGHGLAPKLFIRAGIYAGPGKAAPLNVEPNAIAAKRMTARDEAGAEYLSR